MLKLRTERAVWGYASAVILVSLCVTHLILHYGIDPADHAKYWKVASLICVVLGLMLGYFGGKMINKNAILSDELDYLASHDQLTGSYSRRKFFDLCKNPALYPASLILVDLDHFKKVNDAFGHCGGDTALRHLTTVLGETMRKGDILARLGGEEFIILLPKTPEDAGVAMAWSMLMTLRSSPIEIHEKSLTLTGSFGVSSITRGEDIDKGVHDADAAMYAAKSKGRNQVCQIGDVPPDLLVPDNVHSLARADGSKPRVRLASR